MFLLTARTTGNLKITYNYEKKILDSIDESLIITDLRNNILYCNKSNFNTKIGAGEARSIHEVLEFINESIISGNNIKNLYNKQKNVMGITIFLILQ